MKSLHIERMEKELSELSAKLDAGKAFKLTPAFSKLLPLQQNLLTLQLNTMSTYQSVLSFRIAYDTALEENE